MAWAAFGKLCTGSNCTVSSLLIASSWESFGSIELDRRALSRVLGAKASKPRGNMIKTRGSDEAGFSDKLFMSRCRGI